MLGPLVGQSKPGLRSVLAHWIPTYIVLAQTIEHLQKSNIGKLNLDYRRLATVDIREYAKANITTNLWVVSEPWLYSLAWCYGAESVTTDAVHVLGNVSQPFFFLVS
ncbi:hypothetical protein Chor_010391 [Crotalus horridus]